VATGLSLTGFFLPLLKPVPAAYRWSAKPAIRQQGIQGTRVACGNGDDLPQHVGQARPHVNAVSPRNLQ